VCRRSSSARRWPSTLGLFPVRPVEGLIGGAVAFAVHALLFPPDPLRHVGLAANAVFSGLGRTLQELASALRTGDREQAERALEQARSIDGAVRALGEALALGRDTARSAPLRRAARGALDRQEEISRHLDFAVRNTRVLARDAVRYARGGGLPVVEIADAVSDLAEAVWALAAVFDDPGARDDPRGFALRAARASEVMARSPDLTVTEIAGQVRSTAVDLLRASQAAARDETGLAAESTEEMLAEALHTSSRRPQPTPPDTSA
jgi:hypothetical protein